MTHQDLVARAAQWLSAKGYGVVITDMVNGSPETPDAIGWKSCTSTLIECKVSRSDYLADRHKGFRKRTAHAMGAFRYFMAPAGMLRAAELPDGWGLLEVDGRGVTVVRVAVEREGDRRHEINVLTSALRRLMFAPGMRPAGVHCRVYQIETPGDHRATVGCAAPEARP